MIHAFIIGSASRPWGEMNGIGLTDQSHTMVCDGKCSSSYHGAVATCLKTGDQAQLGPHVSLQSGVAITTPKAAPMHPDKPMVFVWCLLFILSPISSPPNPRRSRAGPPASDKRTGGVPAWAGAAGSANHESSSLFLSAARNCETRTSKALRLPVSWQ